MFIVTAILIQTLTMPLIYRPLLGGDPRNVLMLGGVLMIVGAIATLFVDAGHSERAVQKTSLCFATAVSNRLNQELAPLLLAESQHDSKCRFSLMSEVRNISESWLLPMFPLIALARLDSDAGLLKWMFR